ncbi:MAG: NADPH-dependent FMN reductase [Verrucomicrobium sp.]|nr:NAD(P)H-dependent oxidoreductase [Verrucomicrobium sp.]
MKITLLSGTNRPGSNTRKIVSQLASIYQELGNPVDVLDLADLPQEIFLPTSYANKPESFLPFSDAILKSDGVHIVTPEYNGSLPGVLKYFIDMLKFPESFEHRPVAFTGLGAGMWGALRPVEQLQAIFGYRNAYLLPERVFMPGIFGLLDDEGAISDPDLRDRLKAQAAAFIAFVKKLRA